jgi:hypothetical protein
VSFYFVSGVKSSGKKGRCGSLPHDHELEADIHGKQKMAVVLKPYDEAYGEEVVNDG